VIALGIVAFVVALLVSVMLHEAGHFLTARRFGMKATHFFVGFGPTLWSRRRGETEYGVKAIPAGGFVKIVGMTPLEEVAPEDEPRAFYRQSAGKKAIVLAAGSTVHFLLAIALILGSALVIGKAVERSPGLKAIASCVPVSAEQTCDEPGQLASPAQQAGLRSGDVVVAVDGEPVDAVLPFVQAVRASPGEPIDVTVVRDGERQELTLTPLAVERTSLEDGSRTETVGAIGVELKIRRATESLGPVEAVEHSVETMGLVVDGIARVFTEKLDTIADVYGPERDPEGFIGVVGASRISGEVLASEETWAYKILGFLGLIAALNFFVGVFNLLPLLPLDGGHLAVLGFETVRDKLRRLFGYRGEIQRVDFNKLLPLTYAVVLVFAGFTLFLLGADIVNPITLN
jgi:membrane-associated protease RseP (regulator of RpoE activity)